MLADGGGPHLCIHHHQTVCWVPLIIRSCSAHSFLFILVVQQRVNSLPLSPSELAFVRTGLKE